MKKTAGFVASSGLTLLLIAGHLTGCAQAATPTPAAVPSMTASAPALPVAEGPILMQDRCSECHSIALIESARGTAQDWQATVDRMVDFGAELSPPEEQVLVQYLAQTYHP